MKILGDVWDEWDGTEFETTSRIGQFSDSSHTHLAEKGYYLILVLLLLRT